MQRRLTITGSTLRPRSVARKGRDRRRASREHVWPLLDRGAVAPVVHRTFPLRDAAAAHRLMESSAHIGKLVLTIDQGLKSVWRNRCVPDRDLLSVVVQASSPAVSGSLNVA